MPRIPQDILDRLSYFHREVEDLFRRLFEEELGAPDLGDGPAAPPVDVLETASEMVLRVDLPGVERSEIELHGAPNFVVLRGVKRACRDRGNYLRMERAFGSFQRLLVLPVPGDPARVSARYERGVLEVRVPKVTDRRKIHRQIPID